MMSRYRGKGGTQSMTNSTDRLRECVTKGGPKTPKICVTSFMDGLQGAAAAVATVSDLSLRIRTPPPWGNEPQVKSLIWYCVESMLETEVDFFPTFCLGLSNACEVRIFQLCS